MVKIAVLKERKAGESRVAATPETVQQLVKLGFEVRVETGAGLGSHISDRDLEQAGAVIESNTKSLLSEADIVLKVQPPFDTIGNESEFSLLKKGAAVISHLNPYENKYRLEDLARAQISSFALELVPRITRAQSMDVLSSQSNLAGYRAVIDAVQIFGKAVPMMTTAAGTVQPAKVLVLGAGVAGLQAIATAKRLGAIVSAFDVRPAVKEQVQSLGAKFIEVPAEEAASAETSGGYAKEMSKEYQLKQQALIHETVKQQDIVITTAQIPGKPAPILVTEAMVKDMKSGSVIVDLAVGTGGNCPLSVAGKVVEKFGVTLVGYENMPSRVAADASKLYAKNILNFIKSQWNDKEQRFNFDLNDDITKGCLVTHKGKVIHPHFIGDAISAGEPTTARKAEKSMEATPPRKVLERKPHLKKRIRQEGN